MVAVVSNEYLKVLYDLLYMQVELVFNTIGSNVVYVAEPNLNHV